MSTLGERLRNEYEEEAWSGDEYADWDYANDSMSYADTRLMHTDYTRGGSTYRTTRQR